MRCHYNVLELERTASVDEIKKAYRRLALVWHPDKNVGKEEEANIRFKEITTAYAVLSDPQEKQWYDDHRENILNGGNGTSADETEGGPEPNLWPFFNSACFKGFSGGVGDFYSVYNFVFFQIHSVEASHGSEKGPEVPLGEHDLSVSGVNRFYNHWTHFVTTLSFGWADMFDPREAPSRIVKRAIEKENKKHRDEARRTYQDQVRALVGFVRNLDPRVIAIENERKLRLAEEQTKKIAIREQQAAVKRDLKIRQQQQLQNDDDEIRRRTTERKKAYLLV